MAVLCHELCHHILRASGLERQDDRENERLTDLCMYICGFGANWERGHRRLIVGAAGYSRSHLGYLSSEEYAHARGWASDAWAANGPDRVIGEGPGAAFVLGSEVGELEKKLRNVFPHERTRRRLLRQLERAHPDKPREWILQKALDDRARGR